MKAIQAMNQNNVAGERNKLEQEYAETAQQIADLQARQAQLQRRLTRVNVQTALLGERSVPHYAPWLPFSTNGASRN